MSPPHLWCRVWPGARQCWVELGWRSPNHYFKTSLAQEVGPDNFGPFSRSTLYLREFVDGIGFGDFLEDPSVIAPQKALNQLSMSFTMGIVSQTKGAISDREMKLFIQASPTLGSTYDGYMKQLELLERLAARDSDFYSDYSDKGKFEIEHPTGMSKLSFEIEYHNNEIKNLVAGTTRHARLIMSGHVHIQKSLLNK